MNDQDRTIRRLLLSYVGLLAERESYGPGDGFEYVLWDDLMRPVPERVSREERAELVSLRRGVRAPSWSIIVDMPMKPPYTGAMRAAFTHEG
jgi:hypothetical protein